MHFRDDLLPISEHTAGNFGLLPYTLRRDGGRRRCYSRMSTREPRWACQVPASLHVTDDDLGGSCSRFPRLPSARCRNACIFTSPGPDTKFAQWGPQMPLLDGRVEVDDQTLTTLRRMFRPHRSALVNGQRSLHGHAKTRPEVAAPEPSGLCACRAVHGHGRCVISPTNAARPSWAAQAHNTHTAARLGVSRSLHGRAASAFPHERPDKQGAAALGADDCPRRDARSLLLA